MGSYVRIRYLAHHRIQYDPAHQESRFLLVGIGVLVVDSTLAIFAENDSLSIWPLLDNGYYKSDRNLYCYAPSCSLWKALQQSASMGSYP